MVGIVVVTRASLLIARRTSTWTIDKHLGGLSPECVAVDLRSPAQVYCGTARDGLFRSRDSGGIGSQPDRVSTTRRSPRLMWVTRGKLTGSVWSMPVPNQVRCFAPTMAAIAGWTSPDCARSLLLTPGVFPHAPTRIMFGGSKPT